MDRDSSNKPSLLVTGARRTKPDGQWKKLSALNTQVAYRAHARRREKKSRQQAQAEEDAMVNRPISPLDVSASTAPKAENNVNLKHFTPERGQQLNSGFTMSYETAAAQNHYLVSNEDNHKSHESDGHESNSSSDIPFDQDIVGSVTSLSHQHSSPKKDNLSSNENYLASGRRTSLPSQRARDGIEGSRIPTWQHQVPLSRSFHVYDEILSNVLLDKIKLQEGTLLTHLHTNKRQVFLKKYDNISKEMQIHHSEISPSLEAPRPTLKHDSIAKVEHHREREVLESRLSSVPAHRAPSQQDLQALDPENTTHKKNTTGELATESVITMLSGKLNELNLQNQGTRDASSSPSMNNQSKLIYKAHGSENGSGQPSKRLNHTNDGSSSSSQSGNPDNDGSKKTRRKGESDDKRDDQGSDESISPGSQNEDERFLACPYWVRNPQRYRACSTKKLRDIAGLKQHLKRVHKKPDHHCPRCFRTFERRAKLGEHIRLNNCENRNGDPFADQIDYDTWKQIEKRERGCEKRLVWERIFKLLNPDQITPNSPYVRDQVANNLEHLVELFRFLEPQVVEAAIATRHRCGALMAPETQAVVDEALAIVKAASQNKSCDHPSQEYVWGPTNSEAGPYFNSELMGSQYQFSFSGNSMDLGASVPNIIWPVQQPEIQVLNQEHMMSMIWNRNESIATRHEMDGTIQPLGTSQDSDSSSTYPSSDQDLKEKAPANSIKGSDFEFLNFGTEGTSLFFQGDPQLDLNQESPLY